METFLHLFVAVGCPAMAVFLVAAFYGGDIADWARTQPWRRLMRAKRHVKEASNG